MVEWFRKEKKPLRCKKLDGFTSDGKTVLQVEKHQPLPQTFRMRGSPPEKSKPRDSRSR
jgi:hypothetical protein